MNCLSTIITAAFIFTIALMLGMQSCGNAGDKPAEEPLARVYDKYLYPSDLKGIYKKNMSKADSTLIVGTFIENWAKKNLMLKLAEENIADDAEIKKLVDEYRKVLIQHMYEKRLVQQRLDTLVGQQEINDFYEATKQDYVLKEDVVRCYFIKTPATSPDLDQVKTWWKLKEPTDMEDLKIYSDLYAVMYLLEDSTWINKENLAALLPKSALNKVSWSTGSNMNMTIDGAFYILKINQVARKGQIAPVGYVADKIRDYILHERKIKLIETLSTEMYQRELNKENVEVY